MRVDFVKHNEEVKKIWDGYYSGKPIRVPMIIGCNPRMILLDSKLNKKNISFKEYSENPDIMLNVQLEFRKWVKFTIPQDMRMGLPDDGWDVNVDFQNCYDAAWFGCKIHYRDGQVPDTEPILSGDRKNLLFDKGIPDPFTGIMKRNWDYYEYFKKKQKEGFNFEGRPIKSVIPTGLGTDGILTCAVNLRGIEIFTDFYENPDYVRKLFDFITTAVIKRIKAFRKFLGQPEKSKMLWYADDSIANISTDMYREFVLPCHKKLISELAEEGPHHIHLCGDATRHFKTIKDELNVKSFDTGFPVDFGWLRNELGEDVEIYGGPNINLLLMSNTIDVRKETQRILRSGIMKGKKFVLREGNNLAPGTPIENLWAMYETVKEYGKYV